MSNTYDKYNGCGTHRRALLHLIGQLQSMPHGRVTISDIARWMRVSKPTARKYIRKIESNEEIIITKEQRTSNSTICYIELHPDMLEEYNEGMYHEAYKVFLAQAWKLVL